EDGIRDDLVTGVQTCALPIWMASWTRNTRNSPLACSAPKLRVRPWLNSDGWMRKRRIGSDSRNSQVPSLEPESMTMTSNGHTVRSEERRVGKEWRAARLGGQ